MFSWLSTKAPSTADARRELERKINEVHKEASKGWVDIGPRSQSTFPAERKAVYTGDGFDFFQADIYDPALHDLRKVMWRQSASRGDDELLVKITKPEVQTAVYAGFDISKTLDFGWSRESKLWLMARLGVTLCYSLKGTQDLLQPMFYANNSVGWLTQRPVFPLHVSRRICQEILDPVPSSPRMESGLLQMLRSVPRNRRCEVVIFSDFINLTQQQRILLKEFAKRHRVRAAVIQDDRERVLPAPPSWMPFPMPFRTFSLADGKEYVYWNNRTTRERYTEAFEAHERGLLQFFKEARISYQFFNTNEGSEATKKMITLLSVPPLLRTR